MRHRAKRRACLVAVLGLALAGGSGAAKAAGDGVDTEHLFGFVEGSDIGVPGEKELEQETTGRLGKRGRSFAAFDPSITLKLPLNDRFRIAPGLSFAAYDLALEPGLPSKVRGGFSAAFIETRFRLLDRATHGVGLTLNVVPSIGAIDPGSGLQARTRGLDAGLLLDRELIPDTLVGAINASFSTGTALRAGVRSQGSGMEFAGALAYRVLPDVFVGGEVRYARAYEGLDLGRFAGEALFVGPTIYTTLSDKSWISLAWSAQVAGREAGESTRLDLSTFERHQVRLRIGYSF